MPTLSRDGPAFEVLANRRVPSWPWRYEQLAWTCAGLMLLALHGIMLFLSREFWYGRDVLDRPVIALVVLMVLSGFVYLAAVMLARRPFEPGRWWWIWMLFVGIAMRAFMLPSVPMLDDDYYRYLWDGGRVANGQSPYKIAPVADSTVHGSGGVAREATPPAIAGRVNHPSLRSIYPPVAQVSFAIAHFAAPWRIGGLRLVWFMADLTTLGLLAALLVSTGVPLRQLLIYWWNPLLVKEIHNTAHMDILILPFVVGALVLALRHRLVFSSIALAIGVGVKLWPVILFPALLRYRNPGMRSLITAMAAFIVTAGLVTAPFFLSPVDSSSGLFAYAGKWEMNDSLYLLLYALGSWISPVAPHVAARVLVAALFIGATVWICRAPATDGQQVCRRALYLVAAMFLLSPTQFPWYWIWLLPMLTVTPVSALILLTATLPLYYLRFTMVALGYSAWFDYGVVWIEFGPTLLMLAWAAGQHVRAAVFTRERWNLAHER